MLFRPEFKPHWHDYDGDSLANMPSSLNRRSTALGPGCGPGCYDCASIFQAVDVLEWVRRALRHSERLGNSQLHIGKGVFMKMYKRMESANFVWWAPLLFRPGLARDYYFKCHGPIVTLATARTSARGSAKKSHEFRP